MQRSSSTKRIFFERKADGCLFSFLCVAILCLVVRAFVVCDWHLGWGFYLSSARVERLPGLRRASGYSEEGCNEEWAMRGLEVVVVVVEVR